MHLEDLRRIAEGGGDGRCGRWPSPGLWLGTSLAQIPYPDLNPKLAIPPACRPSRPPAPPAPTVPGHACDLPPGGCLPRPTPCRMHQPAFNGDELPAARLRAEVSRAAPTVSLILPGLLRIALAGHADIDLYRCRIEIDCSQSRYSFSECQINAGVIDWSDRNSLVPLDSLSVKVEDDIG